MSRITTPPNDLVRPEQGFSARPQGIRATEFRGDRSNIFGELLGTVRAAAQTKIGLDALETQRQETVLREQRQARIQQGERQRTTESNFEPQLIKARATYTKTNDPTELNALIDGITSLEDVSQDYKNRLLSEKAEIDVTLYRQEQARIEAASQTLFDRSVADLDLNYLEELEQDTPDILASGSLTQIRDEYESRLIDTITNTNEVLSAELTKSDNFEALVEQASFEFINSINRRRISVLEDQRNRQIELGLDSVITHSGYLAPKEIENQIYDIDPRLSKNEVNELIAQSVLGDLQIKYVDAIQTGDTNVAIERSAEVTQWARSTDDPQIITAVQSTVQTLNKQLETDTEYNDAKFLLERFDTITGDEAKEAYDAVAMDSILLGNSATETKIQVLRDLGIPGSDEQLATIANALRTNDSETLEAAGLDASTILFNAGRVSVQTIVEKDGDKDVVQLFGAKIRRYLRDGSTTSINVVQGMLEPLSSLDVSDIFNGDTSAAGIAAYNWYHMATGLLPSDPQLSGLSAVEQYQYLYDLAEQGDINIPTTTEALDYVKSHATKIQETMLEKGFIDGGSLSIVQDEIRYLTSRNPSLFDSKEKVITDTAINSLLAKGYGYYEGSDKSASYLRYDPYRNMLPDRNLLKAYLTSSNVSAAFSDQFGFEYNDPSQRPVDYILFSIKENIKNTNNPAFDLATFNVDLLDSVEWDLDYSGSDLSSPSGGGVLIMTFDLKGVPVTFTPTTLNGDPIIINRQQFKDAKFNYKRQTPDKRRTINEIARSPRSLLQ